uniref:sigma factor-binding protein Crl n=1 Tax=Thaumasiovibrio occultus TaxID=1891184 RepID=UPI000B358B1F|nr:sigma factor-binding protein Crl [Thaumasiovibrio occultus]
MKSPTHGRLLIKLAAIGPYLREKKSTKGHYFFDSLITCVNAKKSPESREFWGWWMVLELDNDAPLLIYGIGRYDADGQWINEIPPENALAEVHQNLEHFQVLLAKAMKEHFDMSLPEAFEARSDQQPAFLADQA